MGELEGRMICRYRFDQDDPHHFYDEMFKHFLKVYTYLYFSWEERSGLVQDFVLPAQEGPRKMHGRAWAS